MKPVILALIILGGFSTVWPTDFGFRLLPGYFYQIKTTAYQNQSGIWKETVKLDNGNPLLIQYAANTPQVVEAWIPPALYEDTAVDLTIGKVTGNYAALGPIEIYQYELDPYQGGGPQSIKSDPYTNGLSLMIYPTMVKNFCSIEYTLTHTADITLSLYDASGRWIENIMNGNVIRGVYQRTFAVEKLPQGVYFLRLKTDNSDAVQKLIILR